MKVNPCDLVEVANDDVIRWLVWLGEDLSVEDAES